MYLHNVDSSATGHPTAQLGHWEPSSQFLRYREKIPVRPCSDCQKHCSSKVICSKVHYHHHLWWYVPMMVAGPQQPPLIMTFCSCWQSLPVRWLIPNSQRVRQSTHTILGWASPPETGGQQEWRLKGRLHLWEGRSVRSSQHVTLNVIICDILI